MKDIEFLQSIGCTEPESRIYLHLLQNGPTSIRRIAANTKINRGAVYGCLKSLVMLGLISYNRQGQRQKYIAENPDKIHEIIREKKRLLDHTEQEASSLIPALMARADRPIGGPAMKFYEDDEGVVTILRDVLTTTRQLPNKQYHVYSSRSLRRYIYRRFPSFTRKRIAENIFVRAIAVGAGGEPVQLAERRWLPDSTNESLSSYIIIYGNKLALISVSADDTPYGVVVEEPGVAAMQRYLFLQLWGSLPTEEVASSSAGP